MTQYPNNPYRNPYQFRQQQQDTLDRAWGNHPPMVQPLPPQPPHPPMSGWKVVGIVAGTLAAIALVLGLVVGYYVDQHNRDVRRIEKNITNPSCQTYTVNGESVTVC